MKIRLHSSVLRQGKSTLRIDYTSELLYRSQGTPVLDLLFHKSRHDGYSMRQIPAWKHSIFDTTAVAPAAAEVALHPRGQVDALADVQLATIPRLHDVATGLIGSS